MNDIVFVEALEGIYDLFDYVDSFVLGEPLFFKEVVLQCSPFTVLHYDDCAFYCLEIFDEFDDIGIAFEGFHDFYLWLR